MKTIASILFTLLIFSSFAQKIKADGYKVSMTNFTTQEVEFMGKKQIIYLGTVKVKSKDDQAGSYRFYLPALGGNLSHLTVRTMDDTKLEPRLYFMEDKENVKLYPGAEKEKTVKLMSNNSKEEMVLSGVIIWLKEDK